MVKERKQRTKIILFFGIFAVVACLSGLSFFLFLRLSLKKVEFVEEETCSFKEKVVALRILDIDGDHKNELIAILGSNTKNTKAVIAVFRKEKRGQIEELENLPVYLYFHYAPSPPSISVGDLDGDSKNEIAISNGPVITFEGTLKEKWSKEKLIGKIAEGESHDSESKKRRDIGINDSCYVQKLNSGGRSALLVLISEGDLDKDLSIYMFENGSLKKIGDLRFPSKGPSNFGDVDNDGKDEYIVAFAVQKTLIFPLKPNAKPELDLPNSSHPLLSPIAIGDIDNDGKNEIFVNAWFLNVPYKEIVKLDRLLYSLLNFSKLPSWTELDNAPALVKIDKGKVKLSIADGFDYWHTNFAYPPVATIGDIDNDGKNELLLVEPSKPKEIQVYSVKK